MAWTDASDIFCSQEDVERRTGTDFEGATQPYAPTKEQAEDFATASSAHVTLLTERAGNRYDPPASGISDVALRHEIIEASAAGAAYELLKIMYAHGGGPKILELLGFAEKDWFRYVGNMNAGGKDIGSIFQVIATGSGTGSSFTDVDSGETTLVDAPAGEAQPSFTLDDPASDMKIEWT